MKTIFRIFSSVTLVLALSAAWAHAETLSGTVTNKTTGKPSAGDTVTLVDVQAGMSEPVHATSDANGRYTLNTPGAGSFLIRATHQGAGYFIAAPQNGAAGDISVYDVAAKVQGVSIEADVLEVEAQNGQLTVNERIFVHNTSTPPTTQWSKKGFEVILPADATVSETQAQRPAGLPTTLKLQPSGQKGHYFIDFPIQPDKGEKDTLVQVMYTLPYSSGSYTFHSVVTMPADSFAVLLPKSMSLKPGSGVDLKSVPADPGLQTYLLKKAQPGKSIEFTVSGTGAMPREDQSQQAGQGAANGQPGGGIGTPIESPDPLSKYKWWILGGLAIVLVAGAAFLLRAPAGSVAASAPGTAGAVALPAPTSSLLAVLKDELFRLESDKLSGAVTAEEYAENKAALEVVLKRALKSK